MNSDSSTMLLLIPTDIAVHLLPNLPSPEMVMRKSTYKEGKEKQLELNESEVETMKLLMEKSIWRERYLTQEELGELRKVLDAHFSEDVVVQAMKNFESRNV